MSEQLAAADAEQVRHRHRQTVLGQHGVRLGLEPRAHPDELGPVTHELTPLAHLRGGDPCFGQHARTQQIAEHLAVTLIVLDPATLERGQLRRGDEMDVGAGGLQRVDRPVPAVGRFDRHLRCLAGLEHLGDQRLGVVGQPGPAEHLTVVGHVHHHRPVTVQIDRNVRCHQGPPLSWVAVRSPESR